MAKKEKINKDLNLPVEATGIKAESKFTPLEFYSVERGVTRTPTFQEYWRNYGKPWINFGDKDNAYPQEILRLFLDASPIHTALLKKKAKMAAANGFHKDGLDGPALNFLANIFGEDSLDVIGYKSALDLSIFGGFYLSVTWSRSGEKIARIEAVPFQKVRVGKPCKKHISPDGSEHKIEKFYVSRDWENWTRAENEPIEICAFNPLLSKEFPEQIIFIKSVSPGADHYCYSDYTSAINWIKAAYEISVFHLKQLQNGMHGSHIIINKTGTPSAEERELNDLAVKTAFAGTDNAGAILNVYGATGDLAPEIVPMANNGSDQRFKDLMEQVNENIRISHDSSSVVANIETSGKLGNQSEIEEQYDSFQNTVVGPMQKMIEDVINKLAGFNGIYTDFRLKKYTLFSSTVTETEQVKAEEEKMAAEAPQVNDALKGLSAADNADMARIVRDFTKGRLNEHLAMDRLKAYGLTEERAKIILGINE